MARKLAEANEDVPEREVPPPVKVPWKDEDRVSAIRGIVHSLLKIDPAAIYQKLRAAERPGTTVNQTAHALDQVMSLAAEASVLSLFCYRAAKFHEMEFREAEAALREEARAALGSSMTKDGSAKRIPNTDLDAWLWLNRAEQLRAIHHTQIELDAAMKHSSEIAELWRYRSNDLKKLNENARVIGDFQQDR